MKDRLLKLIDVKTIITVTITFVFAYLSITGKLTVDQFMVIGAMVYTYYFAKPALPETDVKK